MENMDIDRELPVLQHSSRVIECMFSRTEASPAPCGYCNKVFATNKKFTDHRRLYHGFYYISFSGSSTLILPYMIAHFALRGKLRAKKGQGSRPFALPHL